LPSTGSRRLKLTRSLAPAGCLRTTGTRTRMPLICRMANSTAQGLSRRTMTPTSRLKHRRRAGNEKCFVVGYALQEVLQSSCYGETAVSAVTQTVESTTGLRFKLLKKRPVPWGVFECAGCTMSNCSIRLHSSCSIRARTTRRTDGNMFYEVKAIVIGC
jgi:hypothetical protein